MNQRPLLSLCIPAYNRAALLAELLDSIFVQWNDNIEIVICEDHSPEREAIASVAAKYQQQYPNCLHYYENKTNLGYDGNLRQLIEKSQGTYCVFLGNDDLLYPNAINTLISVVTRNPDCGVVIRSFASFDHSNPEKVKEIFRYFPTERKISPGMEAIYTAYRRAVVIPGMMIHRDAAHALATERFDGTLLYQLYLVGMMLAHYSVVFVPQIIALSRDGVLPDFGNSKAEKEHTPKEQTPESSVFFMQKMLDIAGYIAKETGFNVFPTIRADIGHYSYPVLAVQATKPKITFIKYFISLNKLGFWRYPLFHLYFIALLIWKPNQLSRLITLIKRYLGYTPQFGLIRKVAK